MLFFVALAAIQPGPPPALSSVHGGGIAFISAMGEPFRADGKLPPVQSWFRGADTNGDGWISQLEFVRDAERFFGTLDTDSSGAIDPDEMKHYEQEVAPRDLRMRAAGRGPERLSGSGSEGIEAGRASGRRGLPPGGERGRGRPPEVGQGPMGRELAQPVASADTDMNRLVTLGEFRTAAAQRFSEKDGNADGRLTEEELRPYPTSDRRNPGRQ